MATVRFRIDFILNTTTKTLSFTDITSDWATSANMRILIWVVAPNGMTIYKNAGYDSGDYSAPDIDPGGGTKTGIVLPTDSDGNALQGEYLFYCKAQDDGTLLTYTGTNSYDLTYSRPVIDIDLSYSCRASELYSTDSTDYDVDAITPGITRTHTITKPTGSGANSPGSTAAASRVVGGGSTAATRLWTGTWTTSISSVLYYVMATWGGDGWITITDTATGTESIVVDSVDNVAGMMTSISALFDRYKTALTESYSDAKRLESVVIKITSLWMEYEQAQRAGSDYSVYAEEMADLLSQEGFSVVLNSDTTEVIIPWGEGTGLPAGSQITFTAVDLTGLTVPGNDNDLAIGSGVANLWDVYHKQGGVWVLIGNISGAAIGIAYASLVLTNSIVNADINAAAAIAYSKLALTGSIINTDINAAAAIALTKLAALTVSRALVTDGAGVISASATTAAEIGYLSGVTSAVQTQLNTKLTTGGGNLVNADVSAAAAIALSKLAALTATRIVGTDGAGVLSALDTGTYPSLTELAYVKGLTSAVQTQLNTKLSTVLNANVDNAAAISLSKLAALTASRVLGSDGSGVITALDTATYPSLTELAYIKGLTSSAQTQINSLTTKTLAQGSIMVGNAGSEAAAVSFKTNAQIPIGNGTTVASQPITGDVSLTSGGVVTIGAAAVTPSKLNTQARTRVISINIDWKTGFIGTKKIRIPWYCTLDHIYVCIDQAVGATDDAWVYLKDQAGNNMSGGSLVAGGLNCGTSTAMGTVVQSAITGNNSFDPADALSLETRKSTPNTGTAWVTLTFIMTDS